MGAAFSPSRRVEVFPPTDAVIVGLVLSATGHTDARSAGEGGGEDDGGGHRTADDQRGHTAVFVFDRLDRLSVGELYAAADELADLLRAWCPGCRLDGVERRPS